ncbi:F-box domain-containing protein [Mycena kentingensis (nom. inval.)]|nr:F-box domain-containing protein [Mycena kentingensis (nom. inval.)]
MTHLTPNLYAADYPGFIVPYSDIDAERRFLRITSHTERKRIGALEPQTQDPLVSPIHRLPVELLMDIFLAAVDIGERLGTYEERCERRTALHLAAVCVNWRQVAVLHAPKMWTSLLSVSTEEPSTKPAIHRARTLLMRSSPLPVSIFVWGNFGFGRTIRCTIFDIVLAVTDRLCFLSLNYNFDILAHMPSGFLPTLPLLQTLHMQSGAQRNNHAAGSNIFLSAPQLRSAIAATSHLEKLPLPYAQLTTLELRHHRTLDESLVSVLSQCRALLRLKLWLNVASDAAAAGAQSYPSRTTLPALSSFTLVGTANHRSRHAHFLSLAPFFAHFTAPRLRALSVHGTAASESSACVLGAAFPKFLRRIAALEELSLSECTMSTPGELQDILAAVPEVRALTVSACPGAIDEAFYARFVDGGAPALPRLRELSIAGLGVACSEEVLDAVIRSRWWVDSDSDAEEEEERGVARWERVEITEEREEEEGDCDEEEDDESGGRASEGFLQMIERLREEGLKLAVSL